MKEKSCLLYQLEDKPTVSHNLLYSLQWAVFIFSLNIIYPLVIGDLYHLPAGETAALVQRSIFIIGLGSLLQVLWGHGLPLTEGISALWFSLFVFLAQGAAGSSQDLTLALRHLEFGHIVLGLIMVALSILGLLEWMQKLFTPLVTGCTLILLALQLSGPFLQGMLGLENGRINAGVALFSLGLTALVTYLSYRGSKIIKSFSVLLGMIIGWGFYELLGLPHQTVLQDLSWEQWFYFPHIFPWGTPRFSVGMVITAAIASLVLISNQVASIAAVRDALERELPSGTGKKSGMMNGISNILAGCFAAIGTIPLANSAGFIRLTGVGAKIPFALAAAILVLVGFIWPLGQFLTMMPLSVAYAVIFNIVAQMLSMGIFNLTKTGLKQRELLIIGLTLLSSVGLMFVPATAFQDLPVIGQTVLSNGLLMGIVLVLFLEHVLFKRKYFSPEE